MERRAKGLDLYSSLSEGELESRDDKYAKDSSLLTKELSDLRKEKIRLEIEAAADKASMDLLRAELNKEKAAKQVACNNAFEEGRRTGSEEAVKAWPLSSEGKEFLELKRTEAVDEFIKSEGCARMLEESQLAFLHSDSFREQVLTTLGPCKRAGFTLGIDTAHGVISSSGVAMDKAALAGSEGDLLDPNAVASLNALLNELFGEVSADPMEEDEVEILDTPSPTPAQPSLGAAAADSSAQTTFSPQVEGEASVLPGDQSAPAKDEAPPDQTPASDPPAA